MRRRAASNGNTGAPWSPYAGRDVGTSPTTRVEAFSDGVMAIVITLLAFGIALPHLPAASDAMLWQALAGLLPKIGAWVVSFVFVLVFWISHHALFATLRQVDRGLLWLNGTFLLCISLVPFPTALAGDYPLRTPPLLLLSAVMLAAAASFSSMRGYLLRADCLLVAHDPAQARAAFRRSLLTPRCCALALVLAVVAPALCVAVLIIVPAMFSRPTPLAELAQGGPA